MSEIPKPTVIGGLVVGLGLLCGARILSDATPLEQATPLALVRAVFTVGLLIGLLWLGSALGLRILRSIRAELESQAERFLYSLGIGLGGIALLTYFAGLLGLYQLWSVTAGLGVLAVLLREELSLVARQTPELPRAYLAERRRYAQSLPDRLAVQVAEISLVLVALRALAPPSGYDGLVYHLYGPREFLRLGRFDVLPDLPHANMPFVPQMLNLLGLVYGSSELAGLLHATFAVAMAAATWGLGKRLFGARLGWMSALIFLSSTVIATYGPLPNVDFGWSYFDFLGVYAFVMWMQSGQRTWLVLSGTAVGLSLGSKYFGLLTAGVITLGIVVHTMTSSRLGPRGFVHLMTYFALPAVLVACPWYLKNWLWLGHPLWTHLVAGPDLENSRYFMSQLHRGRELIDYLLLPIRLFQGDFEIRQTQPPLLFILLPFVLVVPRHRALTFFTLLGLTHLTAWSQGIQTIRYLLPIFPPLSIVAARVLQAATESARLGEASRRLSTWLITASLCWSSLIGLVLLLAERPWLPVIGIESRAEYLQRVIPDFAAVRYINGRSENVSRVLIAGDPRLFYIEAPAQALHNLDSSNLLTGSPVRDLAALQDRGFSHIVVGNNQLNWLARFDPEHRVERWRNEFEALRAAGLTTEMDGPAASVYRIRPRTPDGSNS